MNKLEAAVHGHFITDLYNLSFDMNESVLVGLCFMFLQLNFILIRPCFISLLRLRLGTQKKEGNATKPETNTAGLRHEQAELLL